MRFHLVGLVLLASATMPALAQQRVPVERRVDRLEQEMRAVQRRVFPGGAGSVVAPEIRPEAQANPVGTAGGSAIADLTARVDALEAQLAAITNQSEQNANAVRQLDQAVAQMRSDHQARIERLEQQGAAPAPAEAAPAAEERPDAGEQSGAPAQEEEAAPAATIEPAEAAYNAGYRLWEQRNYEEAQRALEEVGRRYPNSRWASWARNLAGRAYLDDNKPATAARVLLSNYQDNPRGERAADSLFYLGDALTRLNRRTEACRVYDELAQVYPNMREYLSSRLPQARRDARCTTAQ